MIIIIIINIIIIIIIVFVIITEIRMFVQKTDIGVYLLSILIVKLGTQKSKFCWQYFLQVTTLIARVLSWGPDAGHSLPECCLEALMLDTRRPSVVLRPWCWTLIAQVLSWGPDARHSSPECCLEALMLDTHCPGVVLRPWCWTLIARVLSWGPDAGHSSPECCLQALMLDTHRPILSWGPDVSLPPMSLEPLNLHSSIKTSDKIPPSSGTWW